MGINVNLESILFALPQNLNRVIDESLIVLLAVKRKRISGWNLGSDSVDVRSSVLQCFPANNVTDEVHTPPSETFKMNVSLFQRKRPANKANIPGLSAFPKSFKSVRIVTDGIFVVTGKVNSAEQQRSTRVIYEVPSGRMNIIGWDGIPGSWRDAWNCRHRSKKGCG